MKNKTIKIIVLLTALSLIGLILMQLFWIRNALNLAEQHYDHRVSEALHDVMIDIEKYNNKKSDSAKSCCYFPCNTNIDVREFIQTDVLDSLLKMHFRYKNLDSIYEFAIVKSTNDSLLFAKKGAIKQGFPTSCHVAGLSCLKQAGSYHIEVFFPCKKRFIFLQMALWMSVSIVFLLIVIFSFSYIVFTIIKQKKLSEMKNDFINNMTHELKTPISTISMASEVLMKTDTSKDRIEKYSKVIFDENKRLLLLVDRVLKTSELDKKEYELHKEFVDLHELIQQTVAKLCMEQCSKSVILNYNLKASKQHTSVDVVHFSNIINNLVDNAYKYSNEKPEITISSKSNEKGIFISVKDNGIGISQEQQKHVFEKFYRVHTGNRHDVKGFGLGLFYVKIIVEMHGGAVSLKSEINSGSEFTIFLPFEK